MKITALPRLTREQVLAGITSAEIDPQSTVVAFLGIGPQAIALALSGRALRMVVGGPPEEIPPVEEDEIASVSE